MAQMGEKIVRGLLWIGAALGALGGETAGGGGSGNPLVGYQRCRIW